MFDWLKKNVRCVGGVLFRGSLPPRAEDFAALTSQGIAVKNMPAADGVRWALQLEHADWGRAMLRCRRDSLPPPRLVTDLIYGLTPKEREEIRQAGCALNLSMDGKRSHVLGDRKAFLRFLRAVMGDDGVFACDWVARRAWAPAELDDELSHDANLDIAQIFEIHSVRAKDAEDEEDSGDDDKPNPVAWAHTHGLADIGYFDFDVVHPTPELGTVAVDAWRAIAFAIVEGRLTRSTTRFQLASSGSAIRCVDAAEFQSKAEPADTDVRTLPEDHTKDRVVLCEPAPRFFGRGRIRPSKLLSQTMDDGLMFNFSTEATDLMSERASKTLPLLRRLADELEPFEFPVLVKLGYRTDGGGEDDREHLWFQAHRLLSASVDGTLINAPVAVARLKEGQRDQFPLELLSDWTIMTPFGRIDPRSMNVARFIRDHREEMLAVMHAAKEA